MNAMPSVADIDSKHIDNAKRQFVELYGSSLALNVHLKIVVVLLLLTNLGLLGAIYWLLDQYGDMQPLVVRVDPEGRAEAGRFDASQYTPQAAEARYFLGRFTVLHFSRNRSRVHTEYPESLFFLAPGLARETKDVEAFAANHVADDVDIIVTRIVLRQFQHTPYAAEVTFERVFLAPGSREERMRRTYIAQIEFDRLSEVPTSYVRVNPLGFQIKYLHVDDAFIEAGRS